MIDGLLASGMVVSWLNFSNGSYYLYGWSMELVSAAAERAGREVAILQDL